jgi:hypothetical protein
VESIKDREFEGLPLGEVEFDAVWEADAAHHPKDHNKWASHFTKSFQNVTCSIQLIYKN